MSALIKVSLLDPLWADPIKSLIRQNNQARAINEVVNALNPSQSSFNKPQGGQPLPLRVVNGMSTTTSSTITTAARENVALSSVSATVMQASVSSVPVLGQPGNSTIRWTAGLAAHPEHEHEDAAAADSGKDLPDVPVPVLRKPINPSLATLEKAVSAKIYFENLYFPLFRHPPSREQRRLAMEKEMTNMQLSEAQKDYLRSRWRQNETDYLREQRRKVDVSAFVKLKTIGHGRLVAPHRSSRRSAHSFHASLLFRCFWSCVTGSRAFDGPAICHEAGDKLSSSFFTSESQFANVFISHHFISTVAKDGYVT